MSVEYDQYLAEHIGNVHKGLQWMNDNLPLSKEEKEAIWEAMIMHTHDASKYDKDEYDAYDAYFYGGNRSYKIVQDFHNAWLRHIHKNPHHWQYWVLLEDDPESGKLGKPLMIPLDYIFEMIADWWTFSWRSNNLFEMFAWYAEHRDKQIMHPQTRRIVEQILKKMWDVLIMQAAREGKDTMDIEQQYMKFWMGQQMDKDKETKEVLEHAEPEEEEDKHKYGVPELKKFPMPDADHVRSAIRFFNYIDPKYEKELADAIIDRMKEYGLSFDDFTVGDENRFKNYIPKEDHIEHHGTKGMHWGIRNYQYEDGSLTEAGKRRYLVNEGREKKKETVTDPKDKSSSAYWTSDAAKLSGGGGGAVGSDYEDWEKELYKKLLAGGTLIDFSKMSPEQFAALLKQNGIEPTDDISKMMEKAAENYSKYASSNSGASKTTSTQATTNTESKTTEKSTSKSSGSGSSKSSSSENSEKKKSDSQETTKPEGETEEEIKKKEESERLERIIEKLQDVEGIENSIYEQVKDQKAIDDILDDSLKDFREKFKGFTGVDPEDASDEYIDYIRKRVQNHYKLDGWESEVKEKYDEIMEKYPQAGIKNASFASAMQEFFDIDLSVISNAELKDMRDTFDKIYFEKWEKKNNADS